MGSNSLPGASRGEVFFIKYGGDVIVKMITDKKHPRYDSRVELPVDVMTAQTIQQKGVLMPILCTKAGEEHGKQVLQVESGRQRFKAWEWACEDLLKRAAKAGQDKGSVVLPALPVIIKRLSDDRDAVEIRVIENAHRQDDDPVSKARAAADLLDLLGDSPEARERVRVDMHVVSPAMFDQLLSLNDLHPKVQSMITEGKLAMTAGAPLSKLGKDEQVDAATKLVESGQGTVRAVVREVAKRRGRTVSNRPPLPDVKKAFAGLDLRIEAAKQRNAGDERLQFLKGLRAGLDWQITGQDTGDELQKAIDAAEEAAEAAKKEKKEA